MDELLERTDVTRTEIADLELPVVDECAMRADLRRQIATLEARLARLECSNRLPMPEPARASAGPRLVGVAELERIRDGLVARIDAAGHAAGERAEREEIRRRELEEMLLDPAKHPWRRIRAEEIGEQSCREWQSLPRLGLLGMLFGWWRIRLSSGCPLARGPRPGRGPAASGRSAAASC